MLFQHLVEPGDRVVVEQPTYDRTLLLLKQLGAELVPVPLEADGLDVGALEAALAEGPIELAHVIPNAHNPAGCTLSPRSAGAWSSSPPSTTSGSSRTTPTASCPSRASRWRRWSRLDEAGRVFHASSFSKTVSPGVRVGYLAGPAEEIAKLAKRANETYISPNMLAESIVLELCRSGELDRNIDFVKGELKARCEALVAALREQIPEAEFVVPAGRLLPLARPRRGHRHGRPAGRGERRGRLLRRRPRLHDRGRREQPPPLLRPGPGRPGRRGRSPDRHRAGARPLRLAGLAPGGAAPRARAGQLR